jgi:hypothetical protein
VGDRSIDPWSARHTCTCVNDEQEEGEKSRRHGNQIAVLAIALVDTN